METRKFEFSLQNAKHPEGNVRMRSDGHEVIVTSLDHEQKPMETTFLLPQNPIGELRQELETGVTKVTEFHLNDVDEDIYWTLKTSDGGMQLWTDGTFAFDEDSQQERIAVRRHVLERVGELMPENKEAAQQLLNDSALCSPIK